MAELAKKQFVVPFKEAVRRKGDTSKLHWFIRALLMVVTTVLSLLIRFLLPDKLLATSTYWLTVRSLTFHLSITR